jgi:histidinol phosphatase-like PHP family hydrolase
MINSIGVCVFMAALIASFRRHGAVIVIDDDADRVTQVRVLFLRIARFR